MELGTFISIFINNALLIAVLGFAGNYRLERLKGTLQGEIDAIVRRREIYEKLAPALRVFGRDATATESEKADFEEAYSLCYIWAPEEVLQPLDRFLELVTLDEDRQIKGTPEERDQAYDNCMLSMRKDVHPSTKIGYCRVSFTSEKDSSEKDS